MVFQIFRKKGGGGGHNKMELVEIPEISIKWGGGGGGGSIKNDAYKKCFLHQELIRNDGSLL